MMPESRDDAIIKDLGVPKSEKKENSVAVMIYPGVMNLQMEFLHTDRQLCDLLAKQIKTQCDDYNEKINLIPRRTVENFKNSHPDWKQMDLTEVGQHLKADYLIYLELNSLSLYEDRSMGQIYRGRANISVTLVDVNNPDESLDSQVFTCTYPSDARGGEAVDSDTPPEVFRRKFLTYIAKRLSWYVTRYQKRESAIAE
jgi:hypothetical protein